MITENEILLAITELSQFFSGNPERTVCYVAMFGFETVKITASNIEQDVRNCAELANIQNI